MVSVRIVVEPRRRRGWFITTVRFVALLGAFGNLLAALLSSHSWFARAYWVIQAAFLGLVFIGLGGDRGPLLVLDAHDLSLSSGQRLPLADIEETIVRDVHSLGADSGVFELVAKTSEGELVLATEQTERDARYLATLIEAARGKGTGS
jgi:hypothetical protein